MGAGKTTFIRGFIEGATGKPQRVTSPTFGYLHIYPGKFEVYHFDLYRLNEEEEFYAMGFDEYFTLPAFILIEWSERLSSIAYPHSLFTSKFDSSHLYYTVRMRV